MSFCRTAVQLKPRIIMGSSWLHPKHTSYSVQANQSDMSAYLRRFCSRGRETSRRCPGPQHSPRWWAQTQSGYPSSLSGSFHPSSLVHQERHHSIKKTDHESVKMKFKLSFFFFFPFYPVWSERTDPNVMQSEISLSRTGFKHVVSWFGASPLLSPSITPSAGIRWSLSPDLLCDLSCVCLCLFTLAAICENAHGSADAEILFYKIAHTHSCRGL